MLVKLWSKGVLVHCWWKCKLVCHYRKMVQKFLYKNRSTMWSSTSTSECILGRNESRVLKKYLHKNSTNRKLTRLSHQFIWSVLFTDWIQSPTPTQFKLKLLWSWNRQNGQSPQLLLGLFLCLGFLQEYPSHLVQRLLDQKTLCALPFLCGAIAD